MGVWPESQGGCALNHVKDSQSYNPSLTDIKCKLETGLTAKLLRKRLATAENLFLTGWIERGSPISVRTARLCSSRVSGARRAAIPGKAKAEAGWPGWRSATGAWGPRPRSRRRRGSSHALRESGSAADPRHAGNWPKPRLTKTHGNG